MNAFNGMDPDTFDAIYETMYDCPGDPWEQAERIVEEFSIPLQKARAIIAKVVNDKAQAAAQRT